MPWNRSVEGFLRYGEGLQKKFLEVDSWTTKGLATAYGILNADGTPRKLPWVVVGVSTDFSAVDSSMIWIKEKATDEQIKTMLEFEKTTAGKALLPAFKQNLNELKEEQEQLKRFLLNPKPTAVTAELLPQRRQETNSVVANSVVTTPRPSSTTTTAVTATQNRRGARTTSQSVSNEGLVEIERQSKRSFEDVYNADADNGMPSSPRFQMTHFAKDELFKRNSTTTMMSSNEEREELLKQQHEEDERVKANRHKVGEYANTWQRQVDQVSMGTVHSTLKAVAKMMDTIRYPSSMTGQPGLRGVFIMLNDLNPRDASGGGHVSLRDKSQIIVMSTSKADAKHVMAAYRQLRHSHTSKQLQPLLLMPGANDHDYKLRWEVEKYLKSVQKSRVNPSTKPRSSPEITDEEQDESGPEGEDEV